MTTSIYISGGSVRVTEGKRDPLRPSITKTASLKLEEGSVINGIVTDEELFSKSFSEFFRANGFNAKDVWLVINSTELVVKPLTLPRVNEREKMELIRQEFSDSDRGEDAIYDYMQMGATGGKNKSIELIAAQCSRALVDNYAKLFAEIGIKLAHIVPAIDGLVKLLEARKLTESVLFMAADGENLSSIIWSEGKYAYSQRTRLFSNIGSVDYGRELARSADSMLQFFTTLKRESQIEKVLLWYPESDTFDVCADAVRGATGLEVERFSMKEMRVKNDIDPDAILFTAGVMLSSMKDADVLRKPEKKAKSSGEKSSLLPLLIPLGTLAICAAVIFMLRTANDAIQFEIDTLNLYNESDATKESMSAAETLKTNSLAIQEMIASNELAKTALETYPLPNSYVRNQAQACSITGGSISVDEYSASSGRVLLTAVVSYPEQSNEVVRSLYDCGLFRRVNYIGYSFDGSANMYNINVECYLTSEAGK